MSDSLKEKILFKRLAKKDKQAFIEFYEKYFDQIYRYVYFKVGTKEEAEDLTSALFLKLWNCVREGGVTDYKTLKPFVYTVARNLIIDHYRKKALTINQVSFDAGQVTQESEVISRIDLPDESQDIEAKLDIDIEVGVIKEKILLLKDEYREVIIWKYFDEMTTDEIASMLNKPKSNIRVLAHRALKALKELVDGDTNPRQ